MVEEQEECVEASDKFNVVKEENNICMYALNDLPVLNTPRVEGVIKGKTLLTLIDYGSFHNVIR